MPFFSFSFAPRIVSFFNFLIHLIILLLDPYIIELYPAKNYKGETISRRQHADLYYRDFFYYSRSKNPNALTSTNNL